MRLFGVPWQFGFKPLTVEGSVQFVLRFCYFFIVFLLSFFFVHFQIGAVYQKLEAFEQENIVSEWLMLLLFFLPHERSFYDCDDWTDSTTVQQVLGCCFFLPSRNEQN